MEEMRQRMIAAEAEKEEKRKGQLLEGKKMLQEQMEERERAREEAYKEFLREKAAIDELVRKIEEEDERFVCFCLHVRRTLGALFG